MIAWLCETKNSLLVNATIIAAEYKITVGHWPFSDQFHYMANQLSFWLATFTVYLLWSD